MRLHTVRRGSGPAVVLLHGIGSSSDTWQAVAERLADPDGAHGPHTTIAVDLLGHGGSPRPDGEAEYTRDRALDDVDDVLAEAEASTGGRAVLVGHSLGGYLALAHAATRPGVARGIVVLNTGPGFRDPEKREAWNARSRRNWHRFGVPEHVATLNLQEDSVVMERLADIAVPTLVLAGGDDRPEYAGAGEYLARKMPDCTTEVLEGGGHAMHEDTHADVVAERIASMVARTA